MMNNNYDEYQMINRQKIAFRTLIITLILVILNGMISSTYDWAPPMVQALLIIMLAAGYFVTCAIFKNAYLSRKLKNSYLTVLSFATLGMLNIALAFSSLSLLGFSHLIYNGRLNDGIVPLLSGVFFLYFSVITLIKVLWERRQNEND